MKPDDAPLLPAGVRLQQVHAWHQGQADARPDWLAEEVPVALVYNGLSHAVMLASPADLEDFALGFSLTEGLIGDTGELRDLEVQPVCQGIEVRLEIAPARFHALKQRRRQLAGRTGCGLCGTESLDQVRRVLPPAPAVAVAPAAIARALGALREWQAVQQLTGAAHAAAWCGLDGTIRLCREDIGRHNALDKLVGAMVRERLDPAEGFACITSRASFEMVQKAAVAGMGALVAVSAPTALAVETAEACRLALAGFARGAGFVAYSAAERFNPVGRPKGTPAPSHPEIHDGH